MPEPTASLFTPTESRPSPRSSRGLPGAALGIAVAVIAIVIGGLLLLGRSHHPVNPNQPQPLDAYAGSLPLSDLKMSESTSLSGGKSTFLDGTVSNRGNATVTGVTVQVFFANDEGMPPHLETAPLSLIRTREPYVDTQPVSAAPLAPGDSRPFRLIFEAIPDNWNTQMPQIHVISVTHR